MPLLIAARKSAVPPGTPTKIATRVAVAAPALGTRRRGKCVGSTVR